MKLNGTMNHAHTNSVSTMNERGSSEKIRRWMLGGWTRQVRMMWLFIYRSFFVLEVVSFVSSILDQLVTLKSRRVSLGTNASPVGALAPRTNDENCNMSYAAAPETTKVRNIAVDDVV